MGTEVFLLCKKCNKITEGRGSGDRRDSIICESCGRKYIIAVSSGYYKKSIDDKVKSLYIEEGFFNN